MTLIVIPCTSAEVAVTATVATLTSALDNAQPPGAALYRLISTTAAWLAQGPADTTFTAVAATDVCTATGPTLHHAATGDGPVQLTSTGTLPAGLSLATNYWIIALGPSTFQLATSRANALVGTAVNITDAGTGTHTLSTVASAGTGSNFLPSGIPVEVDGVNGAKVSIIRDSADGKASIVRLAAAR